VPYKEETFFLDYFQKLNGCVFGTLAETAEDEPVKSGHGEGSFVVIRGRKKQ
jgi:hypothetical protein